MSSKKGTPGKRSSFPAGIKKYKVGIITAEWNAEVTSKLEKSCFNTLKKYLPEKQIISKKVPGSFELLFGAKALAEQSFVHCVICIGCLVKGDTPHFDYISQTVSQKIGELNLKYNIPFIFGVLTTDNIEQAHSRAGGKKGDKGEDSAYAALQTLALMIDLKSGKKSVGFR